MKDNKRKRNANSDQIKNKKNNLDSQLSEIKNRKLNNNEKDIDKIMNDLFNKLDNILK